MKKILSMILSICSLISAMTVSAQRMYINADGEITLDDAVLTLQKAMGVTITGKVFNESAADINSDGKIALDDAIEILKAAMKVNS